MWEKEKKTLFWRGDASELGKTHHLGANISLHCSIFHNLVLRLYGSFQATSFTLSEPQAVEAESRKKTL